MPSSQYLGITQCFPYGYNDILTPDEASENIIKFSKIFKKRKDKIKNGTINYLVYLDNYIIPVYLKVKNTIVSIGISVTNWAVLKRAGVAGLVLAYLFKFGILNDNSPVNLNSNSWHLTGTEAVINRVIGNSRISDEEVSALFEKSENIIEVSNPKLTAGARAMADARRAATIRSGNAGSSFYADAFTGHPIYHGRPGQHQNGKNGLFGPGRTTVSNDPNNPTGAGGPSSITVLHEGKIEGPSTQITAHDGLEASLSDQSASHLTSKHGHEFGVNDPLPPNPNQKPTKYPQVRTRINSANKSQVKTTITNILEDKNSIVYTDVNIRGTQGQVYYSPEMGVVVGVHTEGTFANQIMKAQPISDLQLTQLREFGRLD